MAPEELPVLGTDPTSFERADAARNRKRILAAAEELFAERGVDQVSMDDIAHAACVGKGTLYRRFGDRASLARSLISERERAFQDELIRGLPPLGPGCPAAERLHAFGDGILDLLELHGELLVAAEAGAPMFRFKSSPYSFYRTHVTLLLGEAAPELDVDHLADVLLAPLGAELFVYQRRVRGMELERVRAGYHRLVDALLSAAAATGPAAARPSAG